MGGGADPPVTSPKGYLPSMGVIARNAELAIRDALGRRPPPDSVTVPLCFGGPMVLPLKEALESYRRRRRSGDDEGILAQQPDLLTLVEEPFARSTPTHSDDTSTA